MSDEQIKNDDFITAIEEGESTQPPGGMIWGSFYETVASNKDSLKVTHDVANGTETALTFNQSVKALLLIAREELTTTAKLAGNDSYIESAPSLHAAVSLVRGALHVLESKPDDTDAVRLIVEFLTAASQVMGMDDEGDACDVHKAMCGRIVRDWDVATEKETQH